MSTLLQLLPCGPNDGDSDAVSSGLDGVTMSLHPMGVLLTCWMPTCVKERESLGWANLAQRVQWKFTSCIFNLGVRKITFSFSTQHPDDSDQVLHTK